MACQLSTISRLNQFRTKVIVSFIRVVSISRTGERRKNCRNCCSTFNLSKLPTNINSYRVNTSNPGDSFINLFFLCHTSKKWQRTFPERVFSWENVEVLASLGRESLLKGTGSVQLTSLY
jgi:hypothetical protein